MTPKKTDTLTPEEQKTLHRLENFARINGLGLFDVRGSLYDRVQTITRNNGRCPCFPDTRPHCPCKECLREVRENGECGCRVFMAPNRDKWRAKGLI